MATEVFLPKLGQTMEEGTIVTWKKNVGDTIEKGEVLMERSSMAYLGLEAGSKILVKTPDGRKFYLYVSGRAHDLYRMTFD